MTTPFYNPLINGFTTDQLKAAFDRISDPEDWKGPIAVSIPGELVTLAVEAIRFYTATEPKIELNIQTMQYIVTSEGYRAGPAGG